MPSPGHASASSLTGSVAEYLRRAAESLPAAAPPLAAGVQLLEPLARATGATRASLLVLNPLTAQLYMLAGLGVPADLVGHDLPSRPRSIADWVLRHQHGRLFQGEVREEAIEGTASERPIDSSLCLPVMGPSGPIGVVNLARTAPAPPFGESDLAAVLQALPSLGVALEGLRFRELAERYAHQLAEGAARRGRARVRDGVNEARGWEFAFARWPGLLESHDFADRVAHGDGTQTLLVADPHGDGVDAANAAAFLQGAFLAASANVRAPGELVERLGAAFGEGHADLTFPRIWVCHLSPNGLLTTAARGAGTPLWIPVGADEPQPLEPAAGEGSTGDESMRLLPGDLVVFLSDAVLSALDPGRRGIARARLMEVLDDVRRHPVDAIARAIGERAVEDRARPATPDDRSVFVLRYHPEI